MQRPLTEAEIISIQPYDKDFLTNTHITSQCRCLHRNRVNSDPPHWNQVNFDHVHNNQLDFMPTLKSSQDLSLTLKSSQLPAQERSLIRCVNSLKPREFRPKYKNQVNLEHRHQTCVYRSRIHSIHTKTNLSSTSHSPFQLPTRKPVNFDARS